MIESHSGTICDWRAETKKACQEGEEWQAFSEILVVAQARWPVKAEPFM
ncbi:hypothetical protein [Mariprofundus aestuarium]|nr:hypothetical protein [Mariprofundus aestuarium]